jgi:hypothetical protein
LDIITSPLRSRSRMGFYIRAEGLLDVWTCLIEDKVLEDAIADSFKLGAMLEEPGGVVECLFSSSLWKLAPLSVN